ncbi:MAG TPA: hypothetical protein VFN13_08015 [Rudaea sp.]|nr:hypothetical protein [Rudaea sp.]
MACNFINLFLIAIVLFVIGTLLDSGVALGLALLAMFFALSALTSTWSFTAPYVPPPRDPPTR